MVSPVAAAVRVIGRYALCEEIAHGGMATVHLGRLAGTAGFARTVAIKRLHPQFAKDPDFVSMFVDEARLAARIHHPNVVSILDVVAEGGELFLVMDYVQGESLARLQQLAASATPIPPDAAVAILLGVLHGLHAAHDAKGENGEPLGIVHRDVSPENVLVGVDGVPRVLDFGVAKGAGRIQTTREGQIKGKLAYMAPEQLRGQVSRTTDVYAAGVVLWETLARRRLFKGENEGVTVTKVMLGCKEPPSAYTPGLPPALDAVAMRALQRDPAERFPTAREMARALESAMVPMSTSALGEWVATLAKATLLARARRVEDVESGVTVDAAWSLVRPAGDVAAPIEERVDAAPVHEDVAVTTVSEVVNLTTVATSTALPERSSPPARPRRWPYVVAASAGLALVAVLGARAGALDAPAVAARPPPESPPAGTAPPIVSPPQPSPVAPTTPAEGTEASEVPPATGQVPRAAPPPPATAPPRPVARPPQPRAPRCDPPYYFDGQGVKIFRKECI